MLKETNIASNGNTEFIVAIGYPHFRLVEIKNGTITYDPEHCWIGTKPGFSLFQQSMFNQKERDIENKHDYATRAVQALREVTESSIVPEVNGFVISVTNASNAFTYQESITMAVLPFTLGGKGSTTAVIGHASAQAGGFSVNICPYAPLPNVLPIHILQGDIDIIYQSKDGSLLYPETKPGIDATEFEELLLERFGIPIRYRISSPIKSYFRRGQKAATAKDLPTAITFYQKALAEPESDQKAQINYNLALAFFHSKKFAEAIKHGSDAVRLDPNIWPHFNQLYAAIRKETQRK